MTYTEKLLALIFNFEEHEKIRGRAYALTYLRVTLEDLSNQVAQEQRKQETPT